MDTYVISLEEVLYGAVLLALTMFVHGAGMMLTLRASDAAKVRFESWESPLIGISVVILASIMIIFTNLVEVMMWAGFFLLKEAQPSQSVAFYNALLNYTTLQAGYLPKRWHLLEPLLAMAGLLTMAWSTGILFMLAQYFQDQQLNRLRRKRDAARQGTHGGGTQSQG